MVTRYQKCKCPSGRHLVQAFPRELINGAIGYVTELKQLSRRKSDRGFEDGKHIIITMLITSGVLFISGGIALWVFVDWLENNEEE